MSDFVPLLEAVRSKIKPPVLIALGSPRPVADLAGALGVPDVTCFQMDTHQAGRLSEIVAERGLDAKVVTAPDLWDVGSDFRTVIVPVHTHGERELKLDVLDQAYHVLSPGGYCVSLSEYRRDQFCPRWHKKVFGKCSESPSTKIGNAFWSARDEGERPRRRHEVRFHARVLGGPFVEFLSRPGVFCYGRLDNGARAMLEAAEVREGDRILDLGCGAGAVGILAAQRAGPDCRVTFIDSNVRAAEVSRLNAESSGLSDSRVFATADVSGPDEAEFDLVLANPPYHAQLAVARLFVERSRPLLKPGGRFAIVTKQPSEVIPMVEEGFPHVEAVEHRGYAVVSARAPFAGAVPAN